MIPVILSGGSGTRLWPLSRTRFPKQFCEIFDQSLQEMSFKRANKLGQPVVVTSQVLRDMTIRLSRGLGINSDSFIYEPQGKNTGPAIACLCKILEMQGHGKEVCAVFSADHLIDDEEMFFKAIRLAELVAQQGKIVTLGIKPTEPATGYGYIQTSYESLLSTPDLNAFSVLKFHEKPAKDTAVKFLSDGNFFWNAGIFIFKVEEMVSKFKKLAPNIWSLMDQLKPDLTNLKDIYSKVPSISLDYAIMELLSTEELACVPCDIGWSDVGSWDAVSEVFEKRTSPIENLVEIESEGNFIQPIKDKTYALIGVQDFVVVDTSDALLILKKGHSQDVKRVVEELKKINPEVTDEHIFEHRPWGKFEILRDSDKFKSKVIHVYPGEQLSYQSHSHREEHWVITRGQGQVILNDEVVPVAYGSYIKIPTLAKHRIRNTGKEVLEFIEVQLGSYFGEDDIVRYQDDYKRN